MHTQKGDYLSDRKKTNYKTAIFPKPQKGKFNLEIYHFFQQFYTCIGEKNK